MESVKEKVKTHTVLDGFYFPFNYSGGIYHEQETNPCLCSIGHSNICLGSQLATAQLVELRIGNSTIHFFPLIFSTKAADAPSGVLYVFSSTAATDGDGGGRSSIGDICPTEDPSAHFCSQQEIENAFFSKGVYFENAFPTTWVDFIAEDNWGNQQSTCSGWAVNWAGVYGRVINTNARSVTGVECTDELPIACCKQMPSP